MEQHTIHALSFEAFTTLLTQSGLGLEPEEIEAMSEKGFLVPLSLNPEARFSSLQLFGVVRYVRAITQRRHPWEQGESVLDGQQISELKDAAQQLAIFSRSLRGDEAALPEREHVERMVRELEKELHANNPYGVLAPVIQGLRHDAIAGLRGEGRLWAEFYGFADQLGHLLEKLELRVTEPAGHPMAARRMSESLQSQSVEVDKARETTEMDGPDLTTPQVPEPEASLGESGSELEEPKVPESVSPVTKMDSNSFTRKPALTANTRSLQERLESLKPTTKPKVHRPAEPVKEDPPEHVASDVSNPAEAEVDMDLEEVSLTELSEGEALEVLPSEEMSLREGHATVPPDAMDQEAQTEARIEALNRKRETLMGQKDWQGLIELYEGEIELFERVQRQHVLMTMAKLQAIKLDNPDAAFKHLVAAVYSEGSLDALNDALDMMIEYDPGRYGMWLSSLDYGEDSPIPRAYHLSLLLAYAEFLSAQVEPVPGGVERLLSVMASRPLEFTDEDLVELVERLVTPSDVALLYDAYTTMNAALGEEPSLGLMLSMRAGHGALEREDAPEAIAFFEQALSHDPGAEPPFHMLVQLYESQEQWSALMDLMERRVAQEPSLKPEYEERLEELKQKEFDAPEVSIEYYQSSLGQDPQNEFALRRLMRLYAKTERHAEGYAFLSRHLDHVQSSIWQAQIHKLMGQIATQHLLAPEEAILHYNSALKLQPKDVTLHESLIQVYHNLQMWQEVTVSIERLLQQELNPEQRVHFLMMSAQVSQEFEDQEKTKTLLKQVLQINPQHEAARILMEQI